MSSFLRLMWRIVFTALIGLWLIWPTYGGIALGMYYWPMNPFLVTALAMLVVVLVALLLPFNVNQFRLISTAAFAVDLSLGVYMAYQGGWVNDTVPWYVWGVGAAFILFGWLGVSRATWRWWNHAQVVDASDDGEDR